MPVARTMFSERRLLVLALLVSVAQSTALGLRLGRRQVRPHLGHGVAEGNGPSGLYGFFGCLFSYTVCQEDEICVNDNLFGSCQRIGSAVDDYQYTLSEDQLRRLEGEVERLVEGGHKWTHLYTQCVLGNVLLAFELNQHYDVDFCKHKARPSLLPPPPKEEGVVVDDLEDVLGIPEESRQENDLFRGYDYAEGGGVYGGGGNSDFLYPKRSDDALEQFYSRGIELPGDPGMDHSGALEFVTVHKYKKNRKRQFLIDQLRQELDSSKFQSPDFSRFKTLESLKFQSPEFSRSVNLDSPKFQSPDFLRFKNLDFSRFQSPDFSKLKSLDSSKSQSPGLSRFKNLDSLWLQGPESSRLQNRDSSRFQSPGSLRYQNKEGEIEREAKDFLSRLTLKELHQLEAMVVDGNKDYADRGEEINADDQGQDEEGEESTFDLQPTFDLDRKRDEDGQAEKEEEEEEDEEEEREAEEGAEIDDIASQLGEDDQYYDAGLGPPAADAAAAAVSDQDGRLDNMDDDDAGAPGVTVEDYRPRDDVQLPVESNSPDKADQTDQTDRSLVSSSSAVQTIDREPAPNEARPNIEIIPDSGLMEESMEEADGLREGRGVGEVTTLPAAVETATVTAKAKYDIVDANYAYLSVMPKTNDPDAAGNLVTELQELLHIPSDSFSDLSVHKGDINFRINHNQDGLNASTVAAKALSFSDELKNRTGLQIVEAGVGHVSDAYISVEDVKTNGRRYFLLTFVLCGVIAGVVFAVILLYVIRRHRLARQKLARVAQTTAEKAAPEVSKDYQDLCRHHMQSKLSEKPEPLHVSGRVGSVSAIENAPVHSPSSRSSTSSWSEEPVTTSMDISTGHIVLSYMEDHLKNKDRLDEEWQALCAYEPEVSAVTVASLPQNERKNRYSDILPYDHSRVVLHAATNMTGSDYINATTIMDHDPRNPAYLVTQGPLPNTIADFWQMVWEQGSVVIVNLTKLTEHGTSLCHCYWPSEGSDLYHIYEVHLVSEHIWCEDYLVRSFYLKNLQTNETRTVTQFHFLTWSDMKIPGSSKALLDFRRKVNKSYRGRSCPILVHCSDGAGRSGTYCLIDMVLNRMTKGAKEIDIAATLEHIRDQRMYMVKTKEQFQFVLATVAEEVHAILKALPQ